MLFLEDGGYQEFSSVHFEFQRSIQYLSGYVKNAFGFESVI